MLLGELLTKIPNKVINTIEEPVTPKKLKRTGYSVILENNDYTPFDVIIITLMKVLDFSKEVAISCAKHIHEEGHAVVVSNISKNKAQKILDDIVEYTKAGGRYPPCRVTIEPS